MNGRIHSFQTLGAVDGPGMRFVVFMQGCNLRCLYCHNPDAWEKEGGTEFSAADVCKRILRYRPYFGESGGVTVSGGEPLLQTEFAYELFSLCKHNGIHTCLDTSGQPMGEWTETLLSVTDLCLLDIKAVNEEAYQKICGIGIKAPLDFLKLLERRSVATWIRQVIVPEFNDNAENIEALNGLLKPFSCVHKVELLPFRNLCIEKYVQMGIEFPFGTTNPLDEKSLLRLSEHLDRRFT